MGGSDISAILDASSDNCSFLACVLSPHLMLVNVVTRWIYLPITSDIVALSTAHAVIYGYQNIFDEYSASKNINYVQKIYMFL